ncbi:MAG: hypothetical protein ACYTDW_01680 [Planctomycetota bacterium]|jgi:hypothetical protein
MKRRKMLSILALGLMACAASVSKAAPMGTAFTYQGRLMDANDPADGEYDFQFRMYDANDAGSQVGGDVNASDVDVIEGYFTVELDFASEVFNGDARWLQILVRPGDSNDVRDFVTLSPRQEVTLAPYAIYAKTAGVAHSLGAPDGSPVTTVYEGNVGIGTTRPTEKLHVAGNIQVDDTLFSSNISSNSPLRLQTAGTTRMYIDDVSSYVGIGTMAPSEKLEVSGGDIKISDPDPEYVFIDDTSGEDDWFIIVNDDEMQIRQIVGDVVAAERIRIDSQGNVGIGITNLWGRLHVHTSYPEIGTTFRITSENINVLNAILFGEGFTDQGIVYEATWSGIGAVGGDLRFIAGGDFNDSDYLDELIFNPHMRIISSGNIGIGKMSPSQKLDVAGTVQMTGFKMPTSAADGYVLTSDSSGVGTWQAAAGGGIGGSGTRNNIPKFTGSTTLGNSVIYETSGYIGIGTTNPRGKLDVNGSIYLRGSELHADYVFEPGYELESIDEHSEFMWKEKHLPAIPKARTDDNGQEIVEVGSHRKGIVEELEKAHIYIEQLHKQNKALETRLVKLEAIVAQLNVSEKGGIK